MSLSSLARFVALGVILVAQSLARADNFVFRTEPGALDAAQTHVQGICCDEDAVYAVFQNIVYKLDWNGRVLRAVDAPVHAGDPCLADGKVIVAMSTSDGVALCEYDLDLNLLRKIKLENGPATDGAAMLDGKFYCGGPSMRETHTRNRLLVYDREFNFLQEVWLDFGVPTSYGFQSIAASEKLGLLFAAFYLDDNAAPEDAPRSIWFDKDFKILGTTRLDGANGWTIAPESRQPGGDLLRFLVARTEKIDGKTVAAFYWFDFDGKEFREANVDRE